MDKFVFTIKKDEEITSSIFNYCKKNNIKSAWISGIGAVSSAVLAFYDLEKKEYKKKELSGKFEIAGLSGNIGTLNGEPVLHLHIIFSDENMVTLGGHLEKATVSVTCEICIIKIDNQIERELDRNIGLNLIK